MPPIRARDDQVRAQAGGGRGALGDRRLPLVHRLGPRHDDQPRGPHALHRPRRRGARHPAHVRAITCATAWSRTCFPRASSEGLYHTADATLWFFHAIDRYLRRTDDDAAAARAAAHPAATSSTAHRAGTRFGIGVDPADGLLAPGRRGLSADVDGRQGRRLGRDAAPRQGRRDQRALVQRAAACSQRWLRASRRRRRGRRARRAWRRRVRASFNARFWNADDRLPLRRRRRRARRRSGVPPEPAVRDRRCRTRCSTRSTGTRCSTSVAARRC